MKHIGDTHWQYCAINALIKLSSAAVTAKTRARYQKVAVASASEEPELVVRWLLRPADWRVVATTFAKNDAVSAKLIYRIARAR